MINGKRKGKGEQDIKGRKQVCLPRTSLASRASGRSPSEPKVPWQSAAPGPAAGAPGPHTTDPSTPRLSAIESDLLPFRSGEEREEKNEQEQEQEQEKGKEKEQCDLVT
jgi:hypothetical protein